MKVLRQKNFFKEKNFEIIAKGLRIKEKSLFKNTEYTVRFENITDEVENYEHKRIEWIVAAFICVSPAIVSMIFGLNKFKLHNLLNILPLMLFLTSICLFTYIYASENYVTLVCTNYTTIKFYRNKDTEKQVKNFIDILLKYRIDYMKNKYATIDTDLPYEFQLNTFLWLKNNKIIFQEEYENLKKMLSK